MAKVKYGEYSCATLKPTWDVPKRKGDKNGYVRGAIGIDGLLDADGDQFMRTFDPAADKFNYGPTYHGGVRRDGSMAVLTNASKDPGLITNAEDNGTSDGWRGVDE
jgi:hypothetical protein